MSMTSGKKILWIPEKNMQLHECREPSPFSKASAFHSALNIEHFRLEMSLHRLSGEHIICSHKKLEVGEPPSYKTLH